jgi:enoyl-CoA hydratase/carnithine racemase
MIFEKLNVSRERQVLFVEISAPPMNLEGPELISDLVSLIQQAEADEAVQVVVFKSADPDYFISHVDVTRIKENREAAAKLDGNPSIGQVLRHMSASRLVTIAQIEGRVRGVGSEFILACDMRFRRSRVSDLRSVRAGLRCDPRSGRGSTSHPTHGSRACAGSSVEC